MKRALTLGLMLIATAVNATDLALSTKHDELRALSPSRESLGQKTQWAPSGNFSALHGRAVFRGEIRSESRPYARARGEVASGIGIFLSRDSAPGDVTSPMSLHRFTYAHGNPVRYTDPSGRFVPLVILGRIIAWEALVIHNEVTTGQGLTESNDALNQRAMRHFESEGIGALSSDASGVDTAAALTTTTGGQFATGAFFGLPNLVLHPMKAAESAVRIPERFIGGAGKVITGQGGESARLEGLGEMGGAFGEAALVAGAVRGGMQGPSGITSTGLWAELGRAAPTASVAAESFSLGTAVMNELQPYNPSVASMRPPWMPREASYTTKLINGDFVEVPEGMPAPALVPPGGPRASQTKGPVVFYPPADASPAQVAQVQCYVGSCNRALQRGELSPSGRVSTKGALRDEASAAAARERVRAEVGGAPYQGNAGHSPDTTWTGAAKPPEWLDLDPTVNSSLGGQSRRYPLGYQPTEFIFEPRPAQ